ncbi:MAG TPA: MotA/TolQ/ExbB proton channel family protein [Chthoniobacteraceae bacterium]|nr:MotA/TolQ/ExbB proton channel family protein [Chthoniobacteraceae bacterium]
MTQFFVHGGFFMYLLVICSLVAVTTMVLRGWALQRDRVIPPVIWQEIESLSPGENRRALSRLVELVEQNDSPLARITQVCLRHIEWPRSENVEAVQTRAKREVIGMDSGLVVLEVIVGIAPLIGLLGAVSGLVTVFASLGTSESISDPRGLALGISEALNTTIAGLAIAIPSLVAYCYFTKKVEALSAEMEAILSELLAKCYSRKSRFGPGRATVSTAAATSETGTPTA